MGDIYTKHKHWHFHAAYNLANVLVNLHRYPEAKSLLRLEIPRARSELGDTDRITLELREKYADALQRDYSLSVDELFEAETIMEDVAQKIRNRLGDQHPVTKSVLKKLKNTRGWASQAREVAEQHGIELQPFVDHMVNEINKLARPSAEEGVAKK